MKKGWLSQFNQLGKGALLRFDLFSLICTEHTGKIKVVLKLQMKAKNDQPRRLGYYYGRCGWLCLFDLPTLLMIPLDSLLITFFMTSILWNFLGLSIFFVSSSSSSASSGSIANSGLSSSRWPRTSSIIFKGDESPRCLVPLLSLWEQPPF